MRIALTSKSRLLLLASISLASASMILAGPPAAAPGGGGGGGGHAAAPAAAAPAAAPHAAAPTQAPSVHTSSPSGPTATARPAQNGAAAQSPNIANGARASAKAQTGHQHVDRDRHYNTVYGNPWWPNATGWNSGWYGNGYGYNGYYTDPSYGLTSTNNNQNNTPPQNADVTRQPAPASVDNNSPSVAAQNENAVKNAPSMITLNSQIQQVQSALDADRQRVIASLKTNTDYQKAINARRNASHEVKNATTMPTNTPAPALINAATAKLEAGDDVTRMEEQAIANDPKAAADKQQLNVLVNQRATQEANIRGH